MLKQGWCLQIVTIVAIVDLKERMPKAKIAMRANNAMKAMKAKNAMRAKNAMKAMNAKNAMRAGRMKKEAMVMEAIVIDPFRKGGYVTEIWCPKDVDHKDLD